MGQHIYYIDVEKEKRNTAGMKAPVDIAEICRKQNFTCFPMPMFPSQRSKFYQKIWLAVIGTFYWSKLNRTVSDGDVVIYQHPMYGNRIALRFIPRIQRRKNCKFIAVIHDLESLRKGIEGVITLNEKTGEISDNALLKTFDAVICHNKYMKKYLVNQGFEEKKLVTLELFDYLIDYNRKQPPKGMNPSIAIAGNLAIGKSAYIYDIFGSDKEKNSELTIHLYGNNFDEAYISDNMIYHGSFPPEELPKHLEGDFGLVWDGPTAETCAGNTGEYLKYNNPHKTSLYLASGMPVIVWKQAAISDFVLENNVGIVVEDLYHLDEIISNISEAEYNIMCKKAQIIGAKAQTGYYFTTALNACLTMLEKDKGTNEDDKNL